MIFQRNFKENESERGSETVRRRKGLVGAADSHPTSLND